MEIKSIEQIKEEVARKFNYNSLWWLQEDYAIDGMRMENFMDEVARRYAEQFQSPTDLLTTEIMVLKERNQELEDFLKSYYRYLNLDEQKLAESLINKGK